MPDLPEPPTTIDPDAYSADEQERDRKSRRNINYECSRCGRPVGRPNLKVKRVQFREMGANAPVIMTRTTDWLCVVDHEDGSPGCLFQDPAWNRDRVIDSPGVRGGRTDA